jgi:hypothetical protein
MEDSMRLLIAALVVVAVLSACGGGEAVQTAATQSPTTSLTVAPTIETNEPEVQPTEAPAQPEVADEPTELPVQPEVADEPTPEPPSGTKGAVSFRNGLAVADQLVLTMGGVAPPPDGFAYEGWLIADDGVTEISTGVFDVAADGGVEYTWTSPTGENLIAQYASFVVTLEPVEDSDPGPSNEVVFQGAASADMLVAARRVFALNEGEPATPRNVSYGQGLLGQSQVATNHMNNALNAAAIGAFGEMRTHSEHVVNIIEGTAGPRFADYTGDGRAENPGDGFGTLTYARQIAVLLPGVGGESGTLEALLVVAQDKAEEILAAPDIASAQADLEGFKALGEQLASLAPTVYGAAQAAAGYPVQAVP